MRVPGGKSLSRRAATVIGGWVALLLFAPISLAALSASPQVPSQGATKPIPSFEVASVRLHASRERPRVRVSAPPGTGRLSVTAMTVKEVILAAYGLQPFLLVDNDSPILEQRIDIDAKGDAAARLPELQRLLQPLLADRFGLAVHREKKEMDAYVLVMATPGRFGPNLKLSSEACGADVGTTNTFALATAVAPNAGESKCGIMPGGVGRIVAKGLDMAGLAALLAPSQLRPVLDRTGLTGRYDIDVTYTPEAFTAAALARRGSTPQAGVDPDGPSIFTALQEQLGVRLQAQRTAVDVLVIDAIRALTEN